MFGRGKDSPGSGAGSTPEPADVYVGLRNQILDLDPASVGLTTNVQDGSAWGFVMETGYPEGTASLVCLMDGTTSLYTSSGGGIIGGGEHPQIAHLSQDLIRIASAYLEQMRPDDDRSLPAPGRVRMHALTFGGPRLYDAAEDDLGNERDPLSPLFHTAHAVIGQLRLVEEARTAR